MKTLLMSLVSVAAALFVAVPVASVVKASFEVTAAQFAALPR
jgi:hypothetical protein